MKATELQIGDWIWLSDDIYVKVEQITKRKIGFHFEGNESKMHYARLCDIDRVPITPEILENNDIQRTGYYSYEWGENDGYEHGSIECRDDGDAFLIRAFAQEPCLGAVEGQFKYVHELQHALRLCKIDKEIEL